nr:hypothetical protein [Tanacetum cinerariifolium]
NTDDDAAFDVKENENDVYVSTNGSDKIGNKKHNEKPKRDDKGKSHVDSTTGVRNLRAKFEEFSSNSTNRVNAFSAPVNDIEPNSPNSTKSFNTASPSVNVVSLNFRIVGKSSFVDPFKYPNDPDMPKLEDIVYLDNEEDVGAKVDFFNLETNIFVSPILITRVHKDHLVTQIIERKATQGLLQSQDSELCKSALTDFTYGFIWTYIFLLENQANESAGPQEANNSAEENRKGDDALSEVVDYSQKTVETESKEQTYSLVVNPTIYVSCIKQFWATATINKVNDVVQLRALIDGKKTPLFASMLVQPQPQAVEEEDVEMPIAPTPPSPTIAPSPTPQDPTPTPPALPPQEQPTATFESFMSLLNNLMETYATLLTETSDETVIDDVSNQGRMIAEVDFDADVVLEDVKEAADEAKEVTEDAKEDETEPGEVQEVVDVVTTAKIITEVVTAASETITAVSVIITTVEAQVPAATLTVAPARVVAAPSRRRKGVVIRDPESESTTSIIIPAEIKFKDKAMKRKPQIEAQARKNMMLYLKNVVGFKMDYFKRVSYDDIRPIFEAMFNLNVAFLLNTKEQIEEDENRALQKLHETLAERAAKRRKLDEEVEELKRHLQIVPKDDDVYTEATPLAQKVPVVDYQIIEMNNKPYYKIIRADDTHQLYVSFLTLLRKEDLEALWSLVKERFSTTKPKNFFDDFLLVTLRAMFKKPDIHAQIWKNQRTVHGPAKVKGWKLLESCGVQIITFTSTQLILLVKRKYLLTRFTLNQIRNAVRLEVEEESEVSLELLRFI